MKIGRWTIVWEGWWAGFYFNWGYSPEFKTSRKDFGPFSIFHNDKP